ncbi:MAG: hypothetical protein ACXAB4_13495 [Candidatus Hodarchaeales archaeon]|jgi:hypothetical protein
MPSSLIHRLRFYNGRTHSIDKKRLFEFEVKALLDRYYSGRDIDAATLLEDLGPLALDFTNVHYWSKEIPDIDRRSARLFTMWAEDEKTKEVIAIFRGFYVLLPFKWRKKDLENYYFCQESVPYYPVVVISAFRTSVRDEEQIDALLDRVKKEIELNWRELRQAIIKALDNQTDLQQRYILCFDQIIHYSFLCPSIDRELIDALRRKDYRTTGVMQLLASPSASYDEILSKQNDERI